MRRTGALAVALSSAALLGFTALAAAPAASAAPAGGGKAAGAPGYAAALAAGEGKGGELPYGVALRMLGDGSVPIVALTKDGIDDGGGDWHPAG